MTPENLLAEWSRLLVESLADAGLCEVVVSPGSRSTPLVYAALACSRLRCRSIVDERAAAFYALGRARLTGEPAAVLCTSGSAAANYFPAIVEAALSHTPLLVVTADRPFELHDAGAAQTIDQTKLYGGYVRRFVELGMPEAAPSALAAVRRRAAQLLFDARSPDPGPVHLNVRARKPLEPSPGRSVEAAQLTRRVDELLASPVSSPDPARRLPTEGAIERIAGDVIEAERGLVVCGPAAASARSYGPALARFARAAGFPVYAEATSQHRFAAPQGLPDELVVDGLDLLLRAPAFRDGRPDVIVQIGAPPVSSAYERWIASTTPIARHVIAEQGWPDPSGDARSLVIADVGAALEGLADAIERRPSSSARREPWRKSLSSANAAAWEAAAELVRREEILSEGAAVRALLAALPSDAVLCVGNSLPVRHLDAYCRAARDTGVTVVSQRGASGIDGLVSGAAGTADAAGRPTALLVGDVSALHDLGGFAVAADVEVPFVIVILNNDGGRIFEQLPLEAAGLPEDRLRFWTTPHGRTFESAARLFDIAYSKVATATELSEAVGAGFARPRATVVEATVPSRGARAQSLALATAVDHAVLAARGPVKR